MPRKVATIPNSKRPPDTDIAQQRLNTWPGKLPSYFFGIILTLLGIISLPIGSYTLNEANSTYEAKQTYDSGSGSLCYISSSNEGRICPITFTFDQDLTGPIYLYYELANFFQNHRRYYQSYDYAQLLGEVLSQSDVSLSCAPLVSNNSDLLNPCGLIANSFFNDVFSLNASATTVPDLVLDESDIALPCDTNDLYKQVNGFQSVNVTSFSLNCSQVGLPDSCKDYTDRVTGQMYKFYYPNDDTTQYLYEAYPNQISPLEGVTNQHFMVWMRTAMFPTFRKLYGSINGSFVSGDQLTINVQANYYVDEFDATKSLLISTVGQYGGKNVFIGQAYLTIGSLLLAVGCAMMIRDFIALRKRLISR